MNNHTLGVQKRSRPKLAILSGIPKGSDKCLVSNEVTQDMEKRNKLMNGVADEVASVEGHESVGVDERSQQ
jgi:hypothetical protein